MFDQMLRSKVKPDVVVYNTILAGYGKQGDANMAFKTFNQMKKRALLPTPHTYSSMFGACGMAGPSAVGILDKVREEMERRDVCPDTIVTNSLISALAHCGKHDEAMQVYLDMTSKTHSDPDVRTFGALLLAVGKDKVRGLEVAQRVWSEMLASSAQVDLYSYNMLLQVLRDGGLEGVVKEDSPLTNTYGQPLRRVIPLVDTNILQKQETNAKKNAGKNTTMKLNWVSKSTASKSVMYVRGQVEFQLSEGLSVVLNVGSTGLDTPPDTRWLEKSSIENIMASLKRSRLKPDVRTFHLLVHLTLDPVHLVVSMKERKISPDSQFMRAAITQQAKKFKNLHSAKVLLQYSREMGLDVGQVGYQAVATSCQKEQDGMQLLEKIKADNVIPNPHVVGTLIGNAVRDHNYEYLTSLVRIMMHLNFVPNATIIEMLDAAAAHKTKSPHQHKRQNGFKGFYTIWKKKSCAETEKLAPADYTL